MPGSVLFSPLYLRDKDPPGRCRGLMVQKQGSQNKGLPFSALYIGPHSLVYGALNRANVL